MKHIFSQLYLNEGQYLETIKNKLHLEEVRNMKRSAQFINLTNDFNDLINILVNDHAQKSMDDRKNNNYNQTLLEKLEVIWKKIIPNIELIPHASSKMINVNKIGEIYSLNGLSDGEKSIIYYIAKVLLAPKKSYIVVDEPETYLHPSIYNKLWDLLIEERKDCQFIFSSHTMDFITARNDVSIAWCKNFKYPDKFELKIIGVDTKMPTDLKIELLGNRKPVIFCEGALSSLDYQVYSSLFLDEYLVKPVGGHNKVIQYTKSYNSLEEFEDSKAFGIIDRDFHGQRRIEGLSKKNIITTKYNEIEMLLLDKRT